MVTTTEQTKQQLQEELRKRDLPVSGTKQELAERLREHEEEADDGEGDAGGQAEDASGDGQAAASTDVAAAGAGSSGGRRPPRVAAIARSAAQQLAALTRRHVEGIAGVSRDDDGWRVEVEVLELSRIPPTTDVLAIYAVYVDADGEMIEYERLERYVRGRTGGSGEG
jgi:hypothetical protein